MPGRAAQHRGEQRPGVAVGVRARGAQADDLRGDGGFVHIKAGRRPVEPGEARHDQQCQQRTQKPAQWPGQAQGRVSPEHGPFTNPAFGRARWRPDQRAILMN